MNGWAAWRTRRSVRWRLLARSAARGLAAGVVLGAALWGAPRDARAALDVETLATRIAESLAAGLTDAKYRTVAVSRIRQDGAGQNVAELVDFINVKIVRARSHKVVDRSRLELLLREQQVQLQDFISTEKYKELGRVLGVDVFIYGTLYRDALVLKGIDVQNSAIVWAELFPLAGQPGDAAYLVSLGQGLVASLEPDLERLRTARIRLVSFWDIETDAPFSPTSVMDHLSVALTKGGALRVVDRENLRLVVEEQQLNQAVFIDERSAKRLGELYGVDAFIYGGIRRRPDGTYLASLKMMNIFNGVIEWADLIAMHEAALGPGGTPATGNSVPVPPGMVYVQAGPFMMGHDGGPGLSAPRHRVELPAFFLDETEVSNAEYQRFVRERRYRAPVGWSRNAFPAGMGDQPVVGVTWDDARRYCEFAGRRLPSEQEWEKAARGNGGADYPWGSNAFSPGFTVTRESGIKQAVPVNQETRDVSPYRARHLAGNVREWVADELRPYPGSPAASDTRFGRERVVRGGSWATTYEAATTHHRGSSQPALAWPDVGFRCAQSVGG